jgi:hypothetical protein
VPERVARALTAPASEPLAVTHVRSTSQGIPSAVAAGRRKLEQARERAERQLADAEIKLDQLGWRDRGRRRTNLRAEIALHRTALRLADEKLAQAVPEPTTQLTPTERERSRQQRPTHEPPTRHRSPNRRHGLKLER